jgi:hypothetical protein
LQFPDAHIPINAAISIVRVPLNYDHIVACVSARDAELETLKVRFHFRNAGFPPKDLSALRPSTDRVVGQRRTQQALHTSVMTWLFHLRNQSPIGFQLQLDAGISRILAWPAKRNRLFQVFSAGHMML